MKKNKFLAILLVLLAAFVTFLSLSFNKAAYLEKNGTNPKDVQETAEVVAEEKEEKIATATIVATGDIMFHMPQIRAGYDSKTDIYDFKDSFEYVKKYIDSADLALGNFETVIAGKEHGFKGYPNFNAPKETLEALKYAGYDVLSTANNHCLDQGKKGLISTIDAIQEYGLKNIGTYEEPNSPILIENVNDINIGLLSYTYGCNGMEYCLTDEELSYMVNVIDEEKIKNDIQRAKDEGADIVAVFIHWGNEYQTEPSSEQLDLGQKMVQWGASIVFGSHPHVVQKSEIVAYEGKNNFVIYSMGNFLSNQRRETMNNKYTEDGIIVSIDIEKNFSTGETVFKNVKYIPTWVRRYKDGQKLKYEIIPTEEFMNGDDNKIDKESLDKIKESFNNTFSKMSQL